MSIKSAKTLYEECSEIIEKSYSVRSYSDEEFSCDEEDECLARELMGRLTPAGLSKLRRRFGRGRGRRVGVDLDRKVQEVMRQAAAAEGIEFGGSGAGGAGDELEIDEAGFVSSIEEIFGHHKYTTHAHKLFQLLDPFATGRIKWRALVDRLVAVGAKKTRTRADVWTPVKERRMERLDHCKRETIVKLVSIGRADSFCYVAVSKGGRVGVYSGLLQLMHSYEVFYQRSGIQRRVKNCWITDCLYLDDVQCLLITASDRSLTVYDAATLTHTPIYCITGLPNIPTCMSYTRLPAGGSELAIGTERGDVTRLKFLQPAVSLLHCKSSEHTNYYYWMELTSPPHTAYCQISTWRRLHARSVRRLSYLKGGEFIITCSHDSNVSVRLKHVQGKLDDYTFKVQRGVTCFHLLPSLHLLATGSPDGVVRLWESTQSSPFASLTAPGMAAVLDVAVVASKEIVLGFCSNCWLHIWDLYEECLLQTIKIKFPFLGVLGKKVEFGAFCIHPGPARKQFSDDDSSSDPMTPRLETVSRRSSVYHGSTGGLMLQPDQIGTNDLHHDNMEYKQFSTPEILITCCDYVCTMELTRSEDEGFVLPPPGDTLTARRPSFWDLPDDVFRQPIISPQPPPSPAAPSAPALACPADSSIPSSLLLSPSTAEYPQDLDTLLENAGLEGILEKDFVLMQGLKHDLNRKLVNMKANSMKTMSAAVNMGAPYLGLRCVEPETVLPGNEMIDEYKRIMKQVPNTNMFMTD